MNITKKIKTTRTLIIAYIADKGKSSVRAIAGVLNIPKSTIHNHLKRIKKRRKYPESHLWDTPEGDAWLRLFFFSTLYTFGLGCNIGADRISRYFKQLRIDTHIGVSPDSLRKRLREMETILAEYQALSEAQAVHKKQPLHITAAADETFFGDILMLVMMDLSSGYLLLEDIADDRTFDTWLEKAKPRLEATNIEIDHLITDRAKALIKLATSGVKCESGSDLFHPLQSLSRGLGKSLKKRYSSVSTALKKSWKDKDILELQEELSEITEIPLEKEKETELDAKISEIKNLNEEKERLKEDSKRYDETIKNISRDVHAFNIETHQQQCSQDVENKLEAHAKTLETIEDTHFPDKKKKTVSSFRKQNKALASCVDVWWYFVLSQLLEFNLSSEEEDWLLHSLLPAVYWHKQMMKTKEPKRRQRYEVAWKSALSLWEAHSLTIRMNGENKGKWQDWALCMVDNFHRSSSAVEGRNGTLSQMYHTRRGLTPARLKALTVIFNYDHYRPDGKTPAEKLFNTSFPNVLEWVNEQMGELPLPRKGKKRKFNKPLNLWSVPH
jgi:hypothetical protein